MTEERPYAVCNLQPRNKGGAIYINLELIEPLLRIMPFGKKLIAVLDEEAKTLTIQPIIIPKPGNP